MSKTKREKGRGINPSATERSANSNRGLMKAGMIVGILLSALIGFGAIISRQNPTAISASKSRTAANPALPLSTPQYNANTPAKEYIYAGSKLVAVSEPVQPAPNDFAVWRLSTGTWYVVGDTGGMTVETWGYSTDKPAPGDYDGDGKTDFCVFRPSEGKWYVIETGGGSAWQEYTFGVSGDIPVPADFDGDGRTDLAVYRPTTQTWYIRHMGSLSERTQNYGASGDTPVPSDFDGDGKADIALWRNSDATWYVWNSGSNSGAGFQWGTTGDKPVAGDYDGDGKSDYAVWESDGTWKIRQSSTGTVMTSVVWGYQASDWAVQGDYDRDGKTDRAVWRPSNGTWYIMKSGGGFRTQAWGQDGDIPVPAPYRR